MINIEQIVRQVINNHLSKDPGFGDEVEIGENWDQPLYSFGADQLDEIEILMVLEEKLGITLPDKDYDTPQDYIDEIRKVLEDDSE